MKKELSIIVGLALTASLSLQAQRTNRSNQVVERGPHHQTVEYVESHTNRTAGLVTKTNRVTTLKTGMNRQVNGEWIEATPELKAVAGGARASGGAHEVFFKSDAASAAVVQITLPGGARLSGHVLGLYYYDAASGQSVRLATIKSSSGEILPDNEVVYRDCFDGLTADLKYRYEAGRLEQDVVIRENPAPPSAFGLNDQTTRMEVITEFLEGQPSGRRERVMKRLAEGAARQTLVEPDWTDEWLDFGAMQMVNGRAFRAGQQPNRESQLKSHPVGKRWEQVGGRKLLIESVEYEVIEKELSAMNLAPTMPTDRRLQASRGRVLANPLLESAPGGEMLVSAQPYVGDGLVIDYDLTASFTNLYLGDLVTYLVEGWVTVSQSLTIYDGAIVKYAPGAKIQVSGYLTTPSSGLAIFTARDDDSVGTILPTSTGQISGMYGYPALELYNVYGTTIRNLQFRHCQIALSDYSGYDNTHYVQYCQFLNCYRGINSNYTPVNCSYLTMCNVYEPFVDHTDPTPLLQQSYTTTLSGCSGGVGAPACNPPGNVYNGAQLVTVTCPTPNVTMRYRLVPAFDTPYTEVTENDPVLPASGQVQVDGAKALMVRAWKNGIPRFCSTSQLHSYLTKLEMPGIAPNATISGNHWTPIELGDYRFSYEDLGIIIDGERFEITEDSIGPSPYYEAGVDTYFDRLPNGWHQIQAVGLFPKSHPVGSDTEYVEIVSAPKTINLDNLATFENWGYGIYGDTHVFKATLKQQSANWELRIYNHTKNSIVRTASGTTTNGKIEWQWNCRDTYGNLRTDLATDPLFQTEITISNTSGGGGGQIVPGPDVFIDAPAYGGWITARQQNMQFAEGGYNEMTQATDAIQGAAALAGFPSTSAPLLFDRYENLATVEPEPQRQTMRENSWQSLRDSIANPENHNIYLFAHGSPTWMGGDLDVLDQNLISKGARNVPGSSSYLGPAWAKRLLKVRGQPRKRFRFAFLDGCHTYGSGFLSTSWAEAFGIEKIQFGDTSHYSPSNNRRGRPSAIVTWRQNIPAGHVSDSTDFSDFRAKWITSWANHYVYTQHLLQSLKYAYENSEWMLGNPDATSWTAFKANYLMVQGYKYLRYKQFNVRGEWSENTAWPPPDDPQQEP